jgi:RNA polymerase sigma factor (sigma-70 family)
MTRLAHLITGSNLVAQDLVHDAFVKVSGRLDVLETPAAYLRVAVVNECRSWLRHQVVVDRHERAQVPGIEPEPALPSEMSRVWHAMRTLNERQRVAVVLRYWLDLPVAEVAQVMDCPTGTVKSLVHRALKVLEEELGDDER